ncbi:DEKNAAC103234, partial [Brettanomyces naardenensis]
MIRCYSFVFCLLLLLDASEVGAAISTESTVTGHINPGVACSYGSAVVSNPGFNVNIYSYPNLDTIIWSTFSPSGFNTAFLESGYQQFGLIGEVTGVTSPQFTINSVTAVEPGQSLYGVPMSLNSFSLELDGFFYAEETGLYTFELDSIDDAVLVWFGDGLSCCDPTGGQDAEPILGASWHDNTNANGAATAYVYMDSGSYYPLRLTFTNWNSNSSLEFHVVTPSGTSITDFDQTVFQFVNFAGECYSSTVTLPYSTITITSGSVSTTYAVQTTTTNSQQHTVTTTD